MAEQHSGEGSSTGGMSVSYTDSNLELNIKTLDSRIFNFHVDKNMPVSSFKGKIADQVGVPVGQQRLIFRGKVLKDEHLLSEYHVENGDTFHLVERQPAQQQTSSGTSSADASGNNGSLGAEGGAGAPRNRIGQISHSVVLGTFNVGDQGEGAAPDLTRVIGAVLNSLGVGSQSITNGSNGAGVQAAVSTNLSTAAPQGNNGEPVQGSAGGPVQAASPFGHPFLSQPLNIPLMGGSVIPPSLNMPIPDSLSTISEFISRMEDVLSRNGYQPTTSSADHPVTEPPSNAQGYPTPEALSIVLRHTQRLLSGASVSALSHIAGRLEQEGGSTDTSVRSQIQNDSVQVGLAMQHLGALFLEIGRTMFMLRMGQSPAEAVVNSGPAVYISQSGPNPIMVQPFPHQTSPLFNPPVASAPNSGATIPVGIIGSAPRNINIHIHAGSSVPAMVSAVGTRNVGGEGAQNERGGAAAPGDTAGARVFPVRNVIATAIPSRTATIAVTPVISGSQPMGGVSTSQPPEAGSIVSEVNSRIRSFLENMRTGSQSPSGQQDDVNSSVGSGGAADTLDLSRSMHSEGVSNSQNSSSQSNNASPSVVEPSPSCASGEFTENPESNLKDLQASGDTSRHSVARDFPIGLGGGLQPKKRSKKNSESGTSTSGDQSQPATAIVQQILQSLSSQSTAARSSSVVAGTGHTGQGTGQGLAAALSGSEGSEGPLDATRMMSEVLDSPALNGLLSGVAQQTGMGSPDMLRNMLQQFTQNPAMMSTVNQLAQQIDRDDVRNVFARPGAGQGGLDLSSMVQQMMPLVSQVLGGASFQNEQEQNLMPEPEPLVSSRSIGDDSSPGQTVQSNVEGLAQQIIARSSSQDIFRAVIQSAMELSGTVVEIAEALSSNQELVDLFMEALRTDLSNRVSGGQS